MRSEWLLVLACGCATMDVEQPIALVFDGISDEHRANVEEAARCWNLQFGTKFVVGEDAPQQVEVFYDDQTCLISAAQVQAGWPTRLAICPERYWDGIVTARGYPVTPFRVFSHELGHTLNIISHPEETLAVMSSGGRPFDEMFLDVDLALFADANPDFTPSSPCTRVIRSFRPGTRADIGHCGCEKERALDLSRPIVIAMADGEFEDSKLGGMQRAAACWNLHYGLLLELRAPNPGDQIAYVEPDISATYPECGLGYGTARARDDDDVLVCVHVREKSETFDESMSDIGTILGVYYRAATYPQYAFDADDDKNFASVYPTQPVQCSGVALGANGCTCAP